MLIETLDGKAPYEVIPVTLDFSPIVSTIDNAFVSISVYHGADASYQSMLLGAFVVDGASVGQLIRNGVNGVIYLIRANIISGNERYSLGVYLPVRELL